MRSRASRSGMIGRMAPFQRGLALALTLGLAGCQQANQPGILGGYGGPRTLGGPNGLAAAGNAPAAQGAAASAAPAAANAPSWFAKSNQPTAEQLQTQLQQMQREYAAMASQNRQIIEARGAIDRDNVDAKKQFAQSQQLLAQREQELAAMREQLRDAANQLAQINQEKRDAQRQSEALLASSRRGGGAIIRPNSSLRANLPQFNSQDVSVRQEGDVVRITLASDKLFQPSTTQLTAEGAGLIDMVAQELAQRYPDQSIGVEGHVDGDPSGGNPGGPHTAGMNPHQFTTGQASVVLDRLAAGGQTRPGQLFVVGHGANYPLYSNATPEGRQQNRRVELVVYPERAGK